MNYLTIFDAPKKNLRLKNKKKGDYDKQQRDMAEKKFRDSIIKEVRPASSSQPFDIRVFFANSNISSKEKDTVLIILIYIFYINQKILNYIYYISFQSYQQS